MTTFKVDPEALILVQRNWTVYHTKWANVEAGLLDDDDLVLIQRMDQIYHMRIGDYRTGKVSLGEFDFVWANLETRDRNEFEPSWKHFHFPWVSLRGLSFTLAPDDPGQPSSNDRVQLRYYGKQSENWDGVPPMIVYPDGTTHDLTGSANGSFRIRSEYYQQDFQPGTYLLVGSFDYIDFFQSYNLQSIGCSEEIWNMMFWWNKGTKTDKQNHTFRANALGTEMFHQCGKFEGNTNGWENLRVRNFTRMFRYCTVFDQDVSGLIPPPDDNKSVFMFHECKAFNNGGEVMDLDMASCTNMEHMFWNATAFNADITGWDTTNVQKMTRAFYNCVAFNQPIGSWTVTNVTSMEETFTECDVFDQDLGGWDVQNVKTFEGAFAYGIFNNGGSDSIKFWDVSNVETFYYMFAQTPFNQPVGNWETTSHTSDDECFQEMFESCADFDQDLSGWCVDKVTRVPDDFAVGTKIENDLTKLPVWGTCP